MSKKYEDMSDKEKNKIQLSAGFILLCVAYILYTVFRAPSLEDYSREFSFHDYATMNQCLNDIPFLAGQEINGLFSDKPEKVSGTLSDGMGFSCKKEVTATRGTYYSGYYAYKKYNSKAVKKPKTPQSQLITVLNVENFPSPEKRKRIRLTIYSENAKTIEERAQTAIGMAYSVFKADPDYYEIDIWLEALPSISKRVALVNYYPYKENAYGAKRDRAWETVQATDFQVVSGSLTGLDSYLSDYKMKE